MAPRVIFLAMLPAWVLALKTLVALPVSGGAFAMQLAAVLLIPDTASSRGFALKAIQLGVDKAAARAPLLRRALPSLKSAALLNVVATVAVASSFLAFSLLPPAVVASGITLSPLLLAPLAQALLFWSARLKVEDDGAMKEASKNERLGGVAGEVVLALLIFGATNAAVLGQGVASAAAWTMLAVVLVYFLAKKALYLLAKYVMS
mmetsp:Transcript_27602/g.69397  ORF Transcript_27602/g.69397 Transcript_27602/m.69397 type:complete len:205 (+) Transcript_27602:83-697(+)